MKTVKIIESEDGQIIRLPEDMHLESTDYCIEKSGHSLILTPLEDNYTEWRKKHFGDMSAEEFNAAWIGRLRKKWTQIVQENTYSNCLGEDGYVKTRLTKNYFHVYAFVMSQLDYGLRAYLFPRLIACATPDDKVKKLICYLIQDEAINVSDSIREAAAKNGLHDLTLNEIISEIKPVESESDQQGEKLDYDKWRNKFLVEKYVDLGKALEDLSQKDDNCT